MTISGQGADLIGFLLVALAAFVGWGAGHRK